MALMKDSEGVVIPKYFGSDLFDMGMYCCGKGLLPMLSLNVPMFIPCYKDGFVDDDDYDESYSSEGFLIVQLDCVMEEYIKTFTEEDGGVGVDAFADYLENYAKRLRVINEQADTKD